MMFAVILTYFCAGCGPSAALTIGPVSAIQCAAVVTDMRKVEAKDEASPATIVCVDENTALIMVNSNGCRPYKTTYFPSGAHQREWLCAKSP